MENSDTEQIKSSFLAGDLPEKEVSRSALCQKGKIQKITGMERTDENSCLFLPIGYLSPLQTFYFKSFVYVPGLSLYLRPLFLSAVQLNFATVSSSPSVLMEWSAKGS